MGKETTKAIIEAQKKSDKPESKKTNWNTTSNRFVCFLDIMGFKDMVMRNTHTEIYDLLIKLSKYRDTLEDVNGLPEEFDSDSLKTVSFSDSIVVFTKNDSLKSFEIMTLAVSWLFAKAIENKIPMKGAISLGEMSVNINRQIFFGQPLIDAYLLEEDVAYYGIVIHDTVEKFINNNSLKENTKKFYIDCKTPLKSGNIKHLNIDWTNWAEDESTSIDETKEYSIKLITELREQTSGKPRKYIDNTLNFIEEVYK